MFCVHLLPSKQCGELLTYVTLRAPFCWTPLHCDKEADHNGGHHTYYDKWIMKKFSPSHSHFLQWICNENICRKQVFMHTMKKIACIWVWCSVWFFRNFSNVVQYSYHQSGVAFLLQTKSRENKKICDIVSKFLFCHFCILECKPPQCWKTPMLRIF